MTIYDVTTKYHITIINLLSQQKQSHMIVTKQLFSILEGY